MAHEIGGRCMGLQVRRAARRLTRIYDDALMPLDVTIGQFSLLTLLAAQESWGMQALADALGTDRSSLTASLKPLERKRLVESRADKNDRRVRHLALTTAGMALLDGAEPLWREAQDKAERLLGNDAPAIIRSVFDRLG
jgi:DNA-binding MarR family transcriptional regulator